MGFHPLEHKIHKELLLQDHKKADFLIMCSGGLDSMVLLEVLRRLQPMHGYHLHILHIHHGRATSKQKAYRDQAKGLVRDHCIEHRLHFLSNKTLPSKILNSEAELRRFRKACVRRLLSRFPHWRVLTGHHQEDLIETRLLQLIRGTGAEGFVSAHGEAEGVWLPLQSCIKKQLYDYAKFQGIDWIEDPSNQQIDAMRNWLRNDWLKALEDRRPGSVHRLGESLSKIARKLAIRQVGSASIYQKIVLMDGAFSRQAYMALPPFEQLDFLSWYLRQSGLRSYTTHHVKEIRKRLDSPQKRFSFNLLKSIWSVDQRQVSLKK